MRDKVCLTDICIRGFKSYSNTIDNQVVLNEDVNVIIGANGVGKSNFISFMEMIAYIASDGFGDYLAKNGFSKSILHFGSNHTKEMVGELAFRVGEKKDVYSFTLAPSVGGVLYFVSERLFYERPEKETPFEREFGVSVEKSNLIETSQENKTVRNILSLLQSCRVFHFNDTSINSGMRSQSYVNNNKYLMSNAGNIAAFLYAMQQNNIRYFNRIVEVIKEVFPRFDGFVLSPTVFNDADNYVMLNWKEKGSEEIFGPYMLSDGTLRFIALVTLLLQPEDTIPSVIILDEPEMGLHPFAIRIIADIIKQTSRKVQFIIATQSVTLLNCFDADCVQVAEYDSRKKTSIIHKIDSTELDAWLEEYTLGELWEKNVLGGAPL